MYEYDLKKLQSTIMIIAKEIKRICDTNNIDYTLYGGTVLGAVRHGGFIPWDDDMDFAMTRENYNKFIECCKKDLSERFLMLEWNDDDTYGNFFLKIMLKGTTAITKGNSTTKYPKGIYVDVFPLDKVPASAFSQKTQQVRAYILLRLIWQKEKYNFDTIYKGWRKIANYFLLIISMPMNRKKLISRLERIMTKCNKYDSKYYSCMCGFYGYKKEMYPKEWLDYPKELFFSNTCFKCISDTDKYLTQMYGDYMKLPPVEKRRTHSFIEIDFGQY